ncbi:MAG: hypothetical protein KGL39_44050 [Patescibacteria group bacterium]|nr:hypothetical protein [Patescibacteria group bacterium]
MTDRERDALVAEKVMHYCVCDICQSGGESIKHYSTEIAAAWQVVEKFASKPAVYYVTVNNCHRDEGIEWCVLIADEEQVYEGQGPLPLAICRAALSAVGVEVEE